MTPTENLHYAIGELAYAVARADGEVQKEERLRFIKIVQSAVEKEKYAFDFSGIIFQVMDKDKISLPDAYNWAMKQVRLNSHYLSPEMKRLFLCVMNKVATAYPPVTTDEKSLIARFERDIMNLHGDPVYYEKTNHPVLKK